MVEVEAIWILLTLRNMALDTSRLYLNTIQWNQERSRLFKCESFLFKPKKRDHPGRCTVAGYRKAGVMLASLKFEKQARI